MKKVFLPIILGLKLFSASATNLSGELEEIQSQNLDFILYVQANQDSIGNGIEPDPNRPRSFPSIYLSTIIEDTGVCINGLNTEDIQFYEIHDEGGNLICSFQDEDMFLEMLFSLTGTFEIRFVLEEFTLTGMITI